MLDVHSYRGADVGSNHFLVVGKTRLKLKKVHPKRPYAVNKLKNILRSYREEFSIKLEVPSLSSVEEQWSQFSHAITETAETVLVRRRGTNKERWITDKMWKLIDERKMPKVKREQKRRFWCWRMEDEECRCLDREVKL